MSGSHGALTTSPVPRHRRRRRLGRTRRAVLEGLPLSIIISVMVIAVGTIVLFGLFSYAKGISLGSITFQTPGAVYPGYIKASPPTQLEVTAWAQSGGTLGGVIVVLNGSGVYSTGVTNSGNGSVFFWVVPVFHNHATSGVISITARYAPGASLVAQPQQSYSTTILVLS